MFTTCKSLLTLFRFILRHLFFSDGRFTSKCNTETVDLLPLEEKEDIKLIQDLLNEFKEKTGSEVAEEILTNFEESRLKFFKVFPKDFRRVLKERAEAEAAKNVPQIEENKVSEEEQKVKDIEDAIPDQSKLDKSRGFMKYKRIKGYYRDVSKRSKDWEEIFDHQFIRKNVRTQASRLVDE